MRESGKLISSNRPIPAVLSPECRGLRSGRWDSENADIGASNVECFSMLGEKQLFIGWRAGSIL